MMRGRPEPPLLLERINLHHGAVGVVAERVTVGLETPAVVDHGLQRRAALRLRIRLEPGFAQRLERFPVRPEAELAPGADVIEEDVERAARRDRRILLADGTGRGVARIRKRRLTGFLKAAIQLLEIGARHEHLAAHFQIRHRRERAAQDHRQRADGPEIRRDVLADAAIAARRAAYEAAALVHQRDPEPVDLWLADVVEVCTGQRTTQTRLELAQIVGRGRVVEREHCCAVLDGTERIDGLAGHALRRAVGGDEVGECALEIPQLAHERVVLGVRDLGSRLGVIQVIVVVDLLPQLADALLSVSPRHEASA